MDIPHHPPDGHDREATHRPRTPNFIEIGSSLSRHLAVITTAASMYFRQGGISVMLFAPGIR